MWGGRSTPALGVTIIPPGLGSKAPNLKGKHCSMAIWGGAEAQRREATCPGLHSKLVVELGFQCLPPDPEP